MDLLDEAGYPKKAIEIYGSRVNVGIIETPDIALAYTGPCGGIIKLFLKIDKNDVIEEAKFQYVRCPASAASGSILTRMIKDRILLEVKKVTKDGVLSALYDLSDEECHCAKLAVIMLHKTISKYEENKKIV